MKPPSGKFVLRIEPALHRELKVQAHSHKVSLNEWIVQHLAGARASSASPIVTKLLDIFPNDLLGVLQFGSSVRGEMRESSDIDLLIVLDEKRPVDRSLYQIWDREFAIPENELFSPQFSHLPPGPEFSSLWLEVALEGVILYDPKGAVWRTLRQIRTAIASGRFYRKMSHGHPYWVREESVHAK